MNDLKKLIETIINTQQIINNEWAASSNYKSLNMRKILVRDLYNNPSLLYSVLEYRKILDDPNKNLSVLFASLDINNLFTRVKTINSIQYKIHNYTKNHDEGKIPVNKCLNDLFGIRIILDENVSYGDIIIWIKEEFPFLKCIDSSKRTYNAIHVYFGIGNSYIFQWELQIWLSKDSDKNLASHAKYKQEYIKWENETKGGNGL